MPLNPISNPDIFIEASQWYRSETLTALRKAYIELIRDHQIPYADNILKTNDWLNYCYYCCLVKALASGPEALIIDWGGLYGHITMILQNMGMQKVFNYLLHHSSHYALFQERFGIPTLWGREPNRLNLDSQSADIFLSSGVLEHVREDGQGDEAVILNEIRRVLKEHGLLFIWNLPAKLGSSELLAIAAGKWHHQYRYWKRDMVRLLENAGFEILCWDKQKFLPGAVMHKLADNLDPVRLLKWDNTLSHWFPFNLLARDFIFIARKRPA
ncbi:MAG TPA: methyltransferase domain-containing protein [Thermodesulfobacteriota bacterium]|nr:methyltransferase domain-containing protein [Thermodesulfobacteriota bacterium]